LTVRELIVLLLDMPLDAVAQVHSEDDRQVGEVQRVELTVDPTDFPPVVVTVIGE
jgi:hypothetical protein